MDLTTIEDISEESISNWISTLASIFSSEKEYLNISATMTNHFIFQLLSLATQNGVSVESMRPLQAVIDGVSRYEALEALSDVNQLLSDFTTSLAFQMSTGESFQLTTG